MAEPEDDVYFGPAWESGESLVLKQGFESVSHDGLQKIVYKDWGKRCTFRDPMARGYIDGHIFSEASRDCPNQDSLKSGKVYHFG